MDIITPEPHFIPGYTGHVPQLLYRNGGTYGKLSHQLLIGPCCTHAPNLIIEPINKIKTAVDSPSNRELKMIVERKRFLDSVYTFPMIPGYDGFIPRMTAQVGKRFMAAAISGVVEHEDLMDIIRCDQRNLVHRNILDNDKGVFEQKVSERLMPLVYKHYKSPLIPVRARAQGGKKLDCTYQESIPPYSKFTVPHFMENDDPEKFIVHGYAGHIPYAMSHFGSPNKKLTNVALCDFTDNFNYRRNVDWCKETRGLTSDCDKGKFRIYPRSKGLIPSYSGHVPGEHFAFGRTFGAATVDAKNWLAKHADADGS